MMFASPKSSARAAALDLVPTSAASVPRRALTEKDAIEIWIARWMRVRQKDILARFACDPRRLYEVWSGERFPEARTKALVRLEAEFPSVLERIDLGLHQRRPLRSGSPDQLALFD